MVYTAQKAHYKPTHALVKVNSAKRTKIEQSPK